MPGYRNTPDVKVAHAHGLLAHLLQTETTDRALRSIRYQMHSARFPVHRDLAGFDFTQSVVDPRQITDLATSAFTDTAENLVFIGGTGTGKSHLATALGVEAITPHAKRARFFSTVELVNQLERENADGKAGRLAHQLVHLDLVILDELGYLPFSQAGGAFRRLPALVSFQRARVVNFRCVSTLPPP